MLIFGVASEDREEVSIDQQIKTDHSYCGGKKVKSATHSVTVLRGWSAPPLNATLAALNDATNTTPGVPKSAGSSLALTTNHSLRANANTVLNDATNVATNNILAKGGSTHLVLSRVAKTTTPTQRY